MNVPRLKGPFEHYNGGKAGNGTYQHIINHIPPHRIFMSLYAGNCGILQYIRPADYTVINDINPDVIRAWDATGLTLAGGYEVSCGPAIEFLTVGLLKPQYARFKNETFIYLDPPYLFDVRRGQQSLYPFEMGTEAQHRELLYKIGQLSEFKIMISHYRCALYDEMLKGWHRYDFKSMTRKGPVTESIYFNYALDGYLHDYTYIGENFRRRERMKRIKVNLIGKLNRLPPVERNALIQEISLEYRSKLR